MGFFGGLVSKIGGAIKSAGNKVKETGKKAASFVKNKVTNTWAKFTGKDKFEEANKLYEKISSRYNRRRTEFESDVDRITAIIEKHIQNINSHKKKIKTELFVEMATNLEKIQDIEFSKDFSIEAYKNEVYSFDSINTRNDLYLIDFHKHKFKTTVQAVFTLGFYTRKKAQETLYKVQEEEKKVEHEIAKMDAELSKLHVIEESLANVEHYFASLIEIYKQLLVRLDNNVHYLYYRCLRFAHKLVRQEMSIKRLPVMQRKELEAIITASKILKTMTETQIISLSEKTTMEDYENIMKKSHEQINNVYDAA
ncbi:DNA repair ATPase [Ornithinibacillus scapharcae]|uniref:DNA repair ATPase n=1 Tax=Ornithinibacillus scapharcae TaxID=1147159 RepID=UPI000225B136|nr:DNA repair ATPase [Ornithinibacillus scapharcae]